MASQNVTENQVSDKPNIQEIIAKQDPARELPGDRLERSMAKLGFIADAVAAARQRPEELLPEHLTGLAMLLDDLRDELKETLLDIEHDRKKQKAAV